MRSCCRSACRFLAVCLAYLSQAACLWAQAPTTNEPDTKEAWVISYALVILSVGVGLYVVCRPARRNKTVKTEPK